MRRKWFGLAHTEGNSEEDGAGIEHQDFSNSEVVDKPVRASADRPDSGQQRSDDAGIELLAMSDIYQTAGIRNPRKGYSIHKVVESCGANICTGYRKK